MNSLSFIPIGGIGTVTKNMYLYEFDGEILIVDCGLGFPDATMLGVDLLIPDVSYLKKNIHKVKGMILTHGHEDHIGGLPYVLETLADKRGLPTFPIYGTKLTAALANSKLAEFGVSTQVRTVGFDEKIHIGKFSISLIRVTHSILDTAHYVIYTPIGTFYHGSDFKLDPTPVDGKPTELEKIKALSEKNVIGLCLDSLRSEKEGRTPSEQMIEETFDREIKNCTGQFIVTTYSSNISRLNQAIRVAKRNGRKVCFVGRSLENAKEVAQKLGYLELDQNSEIKPEQVKHHPRNKVLLLIAGSQGQENSALNRIANGEDKFIKIFEDDVVIFSADPIPGNEVAVHSLIDTLARAGAKVSYSEITDDLHVSGHAAREELREMIQFIKPKKIIPIGGTYRQMVQFRIIALELGYKKQDVFLLENGQEILFTRDGASLGKKVSTQNIYIDELSGEPIKHYVLRDREKLSQDGIIIVLIEIDSQTGQAVENPDIITRGFIVEDEGWFIGALKKEIHKALTAHKHTVTNRNFVRKAIENHIESFIFKKMRRRPLILPVVIEV